MGVGVRMEVDFNIGVGVRTGVGVRMEVDFNIEVGSMLVHFINQKVVQQ